MSDVPPTLAEPQFDPENTNDVERIVAFIYDADRAMDDLFKNPPAGLEGTYFEEQHIAWDQVAMQVQELPGKIRETDVGRFNEVGLTALAGTAKFRLWDDAAKAFLKLRSIRRSSRLLNLGASIMASIADVVNLGEAWKEAMEGAKYITDLAISEGEK